jgi:hypothetical protein
MGQPCEFQVRVGPHRDQVQASGRDLQSKTGPRRAIWARNLERTLKRNGRRRSHSADLEAVYARARCGPVELCVLQLYYARGGARLRYFYLVQVSVAVAFAARSGAIARCIVATCIIAWVSDPGHASSGAMACCPLGVGRRTCYAVHHSCDVRILACATSGALRLACGGLVLALRTVGAAGSARVGLYFPSGTADA